MKQNLGKSN